MVDSPDADDEPTRRDYLGYGVTTAAAGLLAGCLDGTGGADDPSGDGTSATTHAPASTTASTTTEDTTTADDSPYTVTMAPMGETTFERPPESYIAEGPMYADMAVAAGVGDRLDAMLFPTKWVPLPTPYYEQFDVPWTPNEDVESYWADGAPSKEQLYAIDPDVIHADPVKTANFTNFDADDVEEIEANVAPFFANALRVGYGRGADWYDYQSYTILDAFEKIANVYQAQDRVQPFRDVHADLVSTVEDGIPDSPADRPTIAVVAVLQNDISKGFGAQRLGDSNLERKPYRIAGANDAFDGTDLLSVGQGSGKGAWQFGYEKMLDIDPDVIFFDGFLTTFDHDEFRSQFVEPLREHPIGSKLTAVQNDRLYRGGVQYQGPITHLVNLEVTAKQLYPERFGAFTTFDEMSPDDQLFDRERVSSIVAGSTR